MPAVLFRFLVAKYWFNQVMAVHLHDVSTLISKYHCACEHIAVGMSQREVLSERKESCLL